MEICETNLFLFEKNVDNVVKIDKTGILIIEGKNITICSPFVTSRPIGGMHNTVYTHKSKIVNANLILIDARIANKFLDIDQNYPLVVQKSVFFVDENNHFVILDCPRNFMLSEFFIPNSGTILGFCGSNKVPFQFAAFSAKYFYVIEADLDTCNVKEKIQMKVDAVFPYFDGYLIHTDMKLMFYKDGNLDDFYVNIGPESICNVSDNNIIIGTSIQQQKICFNIVGGNKFGLCNLQNNLWDFTCGYVVGLHKNLFVTFSHILYKDRKLSFKLSKPINNPTFIFAGPNLKEDEIIVIIFGQQMFLTCSVPIKILEQ